MFVVLGRRFSAAWLILLQADLGNVKYSYNDVNYVN